jgi:DNA-binding SARP family transcriptional activator
MAVTIQLLGKPAVVDEGGQTRSPRGNKAWALLAYLLLAGRPPNRSHLAELLFFGAADPLGALRWNLAELRRVLGSSLALSGDPVSAALDAETTVDALQRLDTTTVARAPGSVGGELLQGVTVASSGSFESWLLIERQRLTAVARAALYEASLVLLATGDTSTATTVARRAIEIDPYNGDNHAVLIRCLARTGDTQIAREQAARCADLFRRELGVDQPAAVREALTEIDRAPVRRARLSVVQARAMLDAGNAALAAGAVSRGIDELAAAANIAEGLSDEALRAETMLALASALIRSTGARGATCADLLHRAIVCSEAAGDGRLLAAACRELAFLAVLKGHRSQVTSWVERGEAADDDDAGHASLWGVRGMDLSDVAEYPAALRALEESVSFAERSGSLRQRAWSRSMIGRVHLLRDDLAQADLVLRETLATARAEHWMAFLPWPASMLGETRLRMGDLDEAAQFLESAHAMAAEVGDQCYLAMTVRGLALLEWTRGDLDAARRWIGEGLGSSPWYVWARGHLLDAAVELAVASGDPGAATLVAQLTELAARAGMRELTVRAGIHAFRLGDAAGLELSRAMTETIDNPALAARCASTVAPLHGGRTTDAAPLVTRHPAR